MHISIYGFRGNNKIENFSQGKRQNKLIILTCRKCFHMGKLSPDLHTLEVTITIRLTSHTKQCWLGHWRRPGFHGKKPALLNEAFYKYFTNCRIVCVCVCVRVCVWLYLGLCVLIFIALWGHWEGCDGVRLGFRVQKQNGSDSDLSSAWGSKWGYESIYDGRGWSWQSDLALRH